MGIRQIVVVGSASLTLIILPCRFSVAEDTNPTSANSATSKPTQPAARLNLYNFALPPLDDKPSGGSGGIARNGNESNSLQNKPAEQNNSGPGLHWTTVNSRPGVGYQLDKNEDVRLHFGGHGAIASFALHF